MCRHAAHCPRRPVAAPVDGVAFLPMNHAGGFVAENALRDHWQRRGCPPGEIDDGLAVFPLPSDGRTLRADVATVADELAGGMDNDDILAWFACSNTALGGDTPLAHLRTSLPAVLDAARLDRFLHSA